MHGPTNIKFIKKKVHVLLIPKVKMEDNIVMKSREIWFDEAVLKKLIIS